MNEMLKAARGNRKQKDVAKKVGITAGYYSLIERGERRVTYELAYDIAKVLGTTPDAIFLEYQSTKRKQEAAR